jgi:DNA modification methylase
MTFQVLEGDCREGLKLLENASVHSIVTDPPYGLSKDPDIYEVLKNWMAGTAYSKDCGGFMGKTWDSFVPGPEYWKECYRVLKPGGYLLAFGGTRTYDLLAIAIRMAGFEIRDSLHWIYGKGFPKSMDVSKAIDKQKGLERVEIGPKPGHEDFVDRDDNRALFRSDSTLDGFARPWMQDPEAVRKYHMQTAPASVEAKQWEGWGTALKPAHEPIIIARKPFEGTVADNVMLHGTGGLNIAATRVAFTSEADEVESKEKNQHAEFDSGPRTDSANNAYGQYTKDRENYNPPGRWPPNLLFTHSLECELLGEQKIKGVTGGGGIKTPGKYVYEGGYVGKEYEGKIGFVDSDGMETVEAWRCGEGCPIRSLNEKTGTGGSGSGKIKVSEGSKGSGTWSGESNRGMHATGKTNVGIRDWGDKGGASRFFPNLTDHVDLDTIPFHYSAKVSPKERSFEGKIENKHPTLKPIALMRWLVKLVTPPAGTVVDPFCGSGTTGCAAILEGFSFIGFEQDPEFSKLANERLLYTEQNPLNVRRASGEKFSKKDKK